MQFTLRRLFAVVTLAAIALALLGLAEDAYRIVDLPPAEQAALRSLEDRWQRRFSDPPDTTKCNMEHPILVTVRRMAQDGQCHAVAMKLGRGSPAELDALMRDTPEFAQLPYCRLER